MRGGHAVAFLLVRQIFRPTPNSVLCRPPAADAVPDCSATSCRSDQRHLSTAGVRLSSTIGEREPGPEGDEGAGEGTAHPPHDLWPRQDMSAHRGCTESVANEDDERQEHE